MGMTILAVDPFLTKEKARIKSGTLWLILRRWLLEADFITIHTPLTAETKVGSSIENLEKGEERVRIINRARGKIVDEKPWLMPIEAGMVAWAALDMFIPRNPDQPATDRNPQVVVTWHLGASTKEALVNVAIDCGGGDE